MTFTAASDRFNVCYVRTYFLIKKKTFTINKANPINFNKHNSFHASVRINFASFQYGIHVRYLENHNKYISHKLIL